MPQSTSPQGKPLVLWKAASGEPNLRMPGLVLAVEFLWNMGHCMSQTWAPPISWFQEVRQSWHETRNRRRSKIQAPRKNQPQRFPFWIFWILGLRVWSSLIPSIPCPILGAGAWKLGLQVRQERRPSGSLRAGDVPGWKGQWNWGHILQPPMRPNTRISGRRIECCKRSLYLYIYI